MLMGCVSFQVRCRVCSLIRILNTSLLCMQIHRRQGALNTGFNTLFMKVCSAHLSLCVLHTWLSSYVSIAVCSAYLTVKLRLHHCVFRVPDCQAASPSLCVPRTWLSSCGDWTFLVTAVWIWNSFSGRSNLRSAERHDMFVPSTRTQLRRRSFHVAAPAVWNAFPSHHPLVVDSLELGWKLISSHRPTDTDTSENFRWRVYCFTLHLRIWNSLPQHITSRLLLSLEDILLWTLLPVITVVVPAKWHCHLWTR